MLRRANTSDVAELVRFERRVFVAYYALHRFSETHFRRYLMSPLTIAHITKKKGRLVAYSLGIQQSGRRKDVARLQSIGVDPHCRDKGLGTRLLSAFIAAARRRRCRKVMLEVAGANEKAIAFFSRHGFAKVRRLPGYYAPAASGIRMSLALVPKRD